MKRVFARNLEFGVVDQGQGSPLLFVHGFPLNHSMWNAQLAVFAEQHRVIAPDLRGFGSSIDTEGAVSMEDYADDLAAILDELAVPGPVVYCGLSMGGYIGWQFIRKYRQRVRGLVLCDTRAAADMPQAAAARLKMAEEVIADGTQAMAEGMVSNALSPRSITERPEVVAAVKSMILSSDPTGVAAAQRGMAARPDASSQLPQIDVPTLVVVGNDDALSPVAEMRRIAETIPSARLVVIPDAGHLSPLENPQAFNHALADFLNGLGNESNAPSE